MNHAATATRTGDAAGLLTIAEAARLLESSPWEAYCLALNEELGTPLRALDGSGPILVERSEVVALLEGRAEVDAVA